MIEITLVTENDERDPDAPTARPIRAHVNPDTATDAVNAFNNSKPRVAGVYRTTCAVPLDLTDPPRDTVDALDAALGHTALEGTPTIERDDTVIIAGRTDTMWRVIEIIPRLDGDGTTHNLVRLVDTENPQVSIALDDVVLQEKLLEHRKPASSPAALRGRTALIGNLTADIMASGYNTVGPAETLARRLVNLGWRR